MTAVLENPTARVKWLADPSSNRWLEQANARCLAFEAEVLYYQSRTRGGSSGV